MRSMALKTCSFAMSGPMTRLNTGRTTFATLRSIGKMRSKYQLRTSGRLSSRSVSAVGAQSTTRRSYAPSSDARFTSVRLKSSSSPGITDNSSALIASTPPHSMTPST